MSKTKKVIFVVLSALICVFTLAFNFFKISDNTLKVKADTSTSNYLFSGSNIYTPIKRGTGSDNIVDFLLVGIDLTIDTLNSKIDITFRDTVGYWTLNKVSGGYNFASFTFSNQSWSKDFSTIFTGSLTGETLFYNQSYSSWDGSAYLSFAFSGSSQPLQEVIGVTLGSTTTTFSNFSYFCNFIKYFDAQGNYFTAYFRTINLSSYNFTDRTYYFLGADDFSDNQIYNQGYQEGLLDNQTNIYDNGYKAGNTVGYSNGYNAGLNDSNQYTFLNLFGAVLDAPVSTLTNLLNFEIFGVNLLTLFLGLLTLSIILFVLRLIRGGK